MQREQAFVQTIKEHQGIIYKITGIYTKNSEDQKDLYQEIVLQLWRSFDSFQGKSKISTWIYRVALNTAIAHLNRSKRTIQKVSVNFELLDMVDENDRIMDERTRLLYEHIKRLNVIEKGLILLFLEGNSYDEISNITGFSVTNVGTRLQRIKEKLRTTIKL